MSPTDPLRIRDYLSHISAAIGAILEYTRGIDAATYQADRKTQDAVIRNFEIIGEACNRIRKLQPDFAAKHPQVPWSFAYGMRNVLSHGYFNVDQQIVWQTIVNDLPGMKAAVDSILRALPEA